jgi:hypothetical protein
MSALHLVVEGECFTVPIRGVADQCGIFACLVEDDFGSVEADQRIPLPIFCSSDIFRLLLDYLGLRATDPPRSIVVPLQSFSFRCCVDEKDAVFIESIVPPSCDCSGFRAGVHRIIQLLSLASYLQHNHLRQLCAAWAVCSACGQSEAASRELFGLPPLELDQRQAILEELHFFSLA